MFFMVFCAATLAYQLFVVITCTVLVSSTLNIFWNIIYNSFLRFFYYIETDQCLGRIGDPTNVSY